MQLTDEVRELKSMEKEYNNTHYELENKLAAFPQTKQGFEQTINALSQDIEVVSKLPTDCTSGMPKFKITIDNVTYTDKTEAGKALDKMCTMIMKQLAKGDTVTLGSMYGFPITAKCSKDALTGIISVNATVTGASKHIVEFGASAPHNLKKIENVFTSLEEKRNEVQERLNRLDVDIEETKKLLAIPFDKQEELAAKTERLNDLRDELHKEAAGKGETKKRTYYFSMAKTKAIKPPEQSAAASPPVAEKSKNTELGSDGSI